MIKYLFTDKGNIKLNNLDYSFIDDGEIILDTELGIGVIELPNFDIENIIKSLKILKLL